MRDSQFDDILKNKLNGLTSDHSPDWAGFLQEKQIADKADATPDAADQDFDAQVKGSIDAYKATLIPQWSAFLDKKTTLDNNADFDAQAQAALNSHRTQSPSQWEAFKAYKEKAQPTQKDSPYSQSLPKTGEESTPLPFDPQIKEAVSDFHSDSKADWAAFLDYKTKAEGVTPEAAQFDLQVKQELEGYRPRAAETPLWAAFLEKKETSDVDYTADAPHTEFDAEVKYQVDQVQVTSPADWSTFKDYQTNQRFDDEVRSTVDGHQTDSSPQWDAFLKKKKESDGIAANVSFDKGIGGTLGRVSARYNSKHWLMLKARLQRIAALQKGIASYKGLETLFVALMLFTFANHMGPLMDGVLKPTTDTQETISVVEVNETLQENVTTNKSTAANPAGADKSQLLPVAETTLPTATESSTRQTSNNNSNSSESTGTESLVTPINQYESGQSGPPIAEANEINSNSTGASNAIDQDKSPQDDLPTTAGPVAKVLMTQLIDIVAGVDRMDQERALKSPETQVYVDPNIKKTYRDEGHWLHVYGGMEMNLVRTPFDLDTALPERTENPYGYNFEILYSRVKGNIEYELGIGYNAFNYEPHTTFIEDGGRPDYTTLNGENDLVFSRIKLKMLSIPMKLKYHFINNNRWSVYAGAGLNHDFIARVDYEISDTEIEAHQPICQGCPPPMSTVPLLYERSFTTGLFNQGQPVENFDVATRSNNYILRGSINIGAERNISDNVAAYLRAEYLPTLFNSEIGPYNDRINKLGVGMGFKFRLK